MTINTGNVLVGAATMWFAPFGTSGEPAPADTVAEGVAWGGNWVAIGGTQQGLKVSKNPKTIDINIEEQMTPANVVVDTEDIRFDTMLSEDTIAMMKLAYGGGTIVSQAATSSLIAKDTLTLSDGLDLLTVGFEAINAFGFWRRVIIPKVVSVASVDTSYRRAVAQRLYPATFRALCDPTQINIIEKKANHS